MQYPVPGDPPGQVSLPGEIATGFDGKLWFYDGNGKFGRSTPDGQITFFPGPAPVGWGALTAGPDGALWFSHDDVIGTLNTDGNYTTVSVPGLGATKIAADRTGNLWIMQNGPGRSDILRYNVDKTFTTFALPNSDELFNGSQSIALGPDGNMWFTSSHATSPASTINRITSGGQVTEFALSQDPGFANYGLTAGPDGNLWLTEFGEKEIARVSPSGAITEFSTPGFPWGIAPGLNGNVWFSLQGPDAIGEIGADGQMRIFSIPSTGMHFGSEMVQPGPTTLARDGSVWFTDRWVGAIGRLDPSGATSDTAPAPVPAPSPAPGATPSSTSLAIPDRPSPTVAAGSLAVAPTGATLPVASLSESVTNGSRGAFRWQLGTTQTRSTRVAKPLLHDTGHHIKNRGRDVSALHSMGSLASGRGS